MTLRTKLEQLQNDIIANLTAITDRPDGWLPHTVFVEEEGEDCEGRGVPVYNQYQLIDFAADGTCTLRCPISNEDEEHHLSEINIDWLITVLGWHNELVFKHNTNTSLSEPTCAAFNPGDLVCLNEDAIEQVRKNFGDDPAEYRKAMVLEVYNTEPNSDAIRVKDIREDDIQEYPAKYLRLLLPKDERCFLTAPVKSDSEKVLSVFLFPLARFERNATDEEIISDWESDEDYDDLTRKLTPDEFAAECNDEMFADQVYWVRFLNY